MGDAEHEETQTGETEQQSTPKRRRKRAATNAAPKRTSRFDRRAQKTADTLRKLIHVGRPDLDISGKTFVEVVERDADAWGRFLAQLGEWIDPLGRLIDLAFGAPLLVLLDLAPSVRAARRDLTVRRERRREERAIAEEQEMVEREQEPLRHEWEVPHA